MTLGLAWFASVSCGGRSRQELPFGVTLGANGAEARGGTAGGGFGDDGTGARSATSGNAASTSGLGGASAGAGASAAGHTADGGVNTATAGATAGGSGGMAGAGRSSAGAHSDAGTSTNAGRSGGGASAGQSGAGTGGTGSSVGGAGPKPGFPCVDPPWCDPGERCVDCSVGERTRTVCAPDPNRDSAGYQAAVANCFGTTLNYSDCDGPEDCSQGEYCVIANGRVSGQCQTEPAPNPAACCFTCDAPPVCTLCWIDNDCQMGFLCAPTNGTPNDVGGCQPAL